MRNTIWNFLVLAGIIGLVFLLMQPGQDAKPVAPMDYSELVQILDTKPETVKSITVLNGSNEMRVEKANGELAKVVIPSKAGEAAVLAKAEKAQVKVIAKDASSERGVGDILVSLLVSLLPMLIFFGLFLWLMTRMARGPGQISEEMANRRLMEVSPAADRKTFRDVAGCDEAKVEAQEIIDYLRNPGYFTQFGARPPKGVLLVGPPGTGKTLLARAIAGEAQAAFFNITASEFVEMFVGVGASRVRALFNNARKHRPAIIFIDEIDAVGRQRGAGIGGGHDEREQTLNQLLTEMDGFSSNEAIVIMAATNRPDVLDPALVRPGRFDRQILVDAPDVEGREAIFRIHTRNKPLASSVNLRFLAERTPGFTGAEIEGACNEAATVALRRFDLTARSLRESNALAQLNELPREITMEDFDEGIDRVVMGVAKTSRAKTMTVEDKTNTSVHELGHALISELIEGGDPVTKITIVPRARALGYTQALPAGDRYNYTIKQLIARIMMAMGGRAAQEVLLGTIDTGASNDFHQAYGIARRMVTEWGMSSLGPISVTGNGGNPFLGRAMAMPDEAGPELANAIDREARCIVDTCLNRAKELIAEHRDFMWAANKILMKRETLLAQDWRLLLAEHGIKLHEVTVEPVCGKIRGVKDCASCQQPVPSSTSSPTAPPAEACSGGPSEDESISCCGNDEPGSGSPDSRATPGGDAGAK